MFYFLFELIISFSFPFLSNWLFKLSIIYWFPNIWMNLYISEGFFIFLLFKLLMMWINILFIVSLFLMVYLEWYLLQTIFESGLVYSSFCMALECRKKTNKYPSSSSYIYMKWIEGPERKATPRFFKFKCFFFLCIYST